MDYGLLSLLPPLLAIALAIVTRQILIPLAIAVFCGSLILRFDAEATWVQWVQQAIQGFAASIWEAAMSYDHRRAVVFSLLLGAMVGVLEAGGGMRALIGRLARNVRSRRGGQTLITSLGLGIFFDDYANTLLVGGTMRTTADRFGISRAKLAYLVDSTSAPVAGLAPISTWVVTEISFVASGLALISATDASAFSLFMATLPYRFYAILALVMVFAIAISDRDFGPMRFADGKIDSPLPLPPDTPAADFAAPPATARTSDATAPQLGWAAVIPVTVCIAVVITSLYFSGRDSVTAETVGLIRTAGAIISGGDSYQALIHGGAAGLLTAIVLHRLLGNVPWLTLWGGTYRGALQILPAMVILWLAWALSDQTDKSQLDTGGYLGSQISDQISAVYLPTAVFLAAAAVAFSTGTSWGTMAILTPMSIELAMKIVPPGVDGGVDPFNPICVATVGNVLAGAIFGDHCSPLSDTTVLSSRASGCDHVVHVQTQMPYAISVGLISIVCGTLPVAIGVSPYLCLTLGSLAIIGMVYTCGARAEPIEPLTDPGGDDFAAPSTVTDSATNTEQIRSHALIDDILGGSQPDRTG